MPLLKRLFQTTTLGAGATIASFFVYTRNSYIDPSYAPSPADSVFGSPQYARQNPSGNPTFHDYCIRKVPLSKIKPGLLADEDRLTTEFCRGVWSGLGYRYQRRYLEKKYRGPKTSHQLWDASSLATSDYPVGTQITDHFEVVHHDQEHVTVRCGDSPLVTGVRPSDGLFEMVAKVHKDEGYVEFGLKSVFFQGLGKSEAPPFGPTMDWLHKQYTKLWMETAIRNCTR